MGQVFHGQSRAGDGAKRGANELSGRGTSEWDGARLVGKLFLEILW